MKGSGVAALGGVALMVALATGARAQDPVDCGSDLTDLAWLAGEWTGQQGEVAMTESWMAPAGGVMLGLHRDVAGPDRSFFEFLRIAPAEDGVPVYHASPGGRPATAFRLLECGPGRVVFENPEHDYPQRIVYERDGETLVARIEGVEEGREKSSEWRYTPGRDADRRALLDECPDRPGSAP